MSYPWIKDSQYGTTPSETDYLEVISPKGLYLNSTTSGTNSNAILMKGFITGATGTPITSYYYCDKLRYYPNVWGGETILDQAILRFADSAGSTISQLNLSGLMCFNPGVTTYFQSSNNGQYQSIGSSGEQIYISSNGGSGNIYFTAAGLYLNGSPIGGGGGGGVTDIQAGSGISVNQTTGNVTVTNIGVLDIQAGSGISVNQTTGSVIITNTGGGGSYGIDLLQAGPGINVYQVSTGPNIWQIDNTGGGGGGVTDIQAGTGISVNQNTGSVTVSTAPFKYIFPTFNAGSVNNGGTGSGGNQIFISAGTYQITYTITFDNKFTQSTYNWYMVKAYCWLGGLNYGASNPYMVSSVGFYPSQVISYDGSYPNCITATDYISIKNDDFFNLAVYQENQIDQASQIFISAILILE